nr:dysferlin-like [Podarcis muralis]XP_028572353.1 dysferlin-like isoform X2 [Podarcis muralis]XP_028572354.1 dysferlin-like isoform X2 [Podarcis muralis]
MGKWLSLYDPANLNAGLRGYVKVHLCVLGAGDQAPDAAHLPDSGDLEANLLQAAVMPAVRRAMLQLFVYRAEDLSPSVLNVGQDRSSYQPIDHPEPLRPYPDVTTKASPPPPY